MRCGGMRWPRPWRGKKATVTPSTWPIITLSLGGPYGVATLSSSTSSSNWYRPEPPKTPTWARLRRGRSNTGIRRHRQAPGSTAIEQRPQALGVRGPGDATLGDDGVDVAGRGDVEG